MEAPISFAASDAESELGLVVRDAFCIRMASVGEGGRGGGFIVCATASGMVLIFEDDVTGATSRHCQPDTPVDAPISLTRVVSPDSGLHERFHPIPRHDTVTRAEVVRCICLVKRFEPVLSSVNSAVRHELVS